MTARAMIEPKAEGRAGLMAVGVPLLGALTIAAIFAFTPASAWLPRASHFHGRDVSAEHWGGPFALSDPSGRRISLADQKGKTVVLAFGYTHCPDACPTTLTGLAEVRRLLGPDASRLQVIFVTIDPERDTAQLLGQYVTAFDPTFVALRGNESETDAVATAYHADYRIMNYQGEILVDHTTDSYLIDTAGRTRIVLPHSLSPREIADDVREVLTEPRRCWPWES